MLNLIFYQPENILSFSYLILFFDSKLASLIPVPGKERVSQSVSMCLSVSQSVPVTWVREEPSRVSILRL